MVMLPALKKVYCFHCDKWLTNQSIESEYEIFIHDHHMEPEDYSLLVVGEQRLDN